jgi:hypothetical protein
MGMNTGGPAFPHVADLVQHSPNGGITTKPITSNGMTLRDYFAAKAMQAILIHHKLEDCDDFVVASNAYQMADFMLKARQE